MAIDEVSCPFDLLESPHSLGASRGTWLRICYTLMCLGTSHDARALLTVAIRFTNRRRRMASNRSCTFLNDWPKNDWPTNDKAVKFPIHGDPHRGGAMLAVGQPQPACEQVE